MELSSQIAGSDKERTHVNCWWFAFEAKCSSFAAALSRYFAYVPPTIVLKHCLSTRLFCFVCLFVCWWLVVWLKRLVISWDVFLMALYIWQVIGKGMYTH
jgi:hypothetical protein